jgi:hypothetical protein
MQIMGDLLTRDLDMIVLQTIILLLFAVLAVIIKMELLREKSRILHLVDKFCCFMQSVFSLNISQLFYGHLLLNAMKIDLIILLIGLMSRLPSRHLQTLNLPQSMCPIFIPLVVRVATWIIVFNQGEKKSQNGNLGLEWEYTHASNVSMILNPRMGHVSPQFHVVYNDDFMTVQYLCTATVPSHWAALVQASASVELYTEQEVQTWQLLFELDVEPGDFGSDTSINEFKSTVAKTSEGDEISEGVDNVIHVQD